MPAFGSEVRYYYSLPKLLYKHLKMIVEKKGHQCLPGQDAEKCKRYMVSQQT